MTNFSPEPSGGRRLTLGLMLPDLSDARYKQVWHGVRDEIQDRDVNLITFAAGTVGRTVPEEDGRKALAKLIAPELLDGLITFQFWLSQEAFDGICAPYRPLPIVNLLRQYHAYPGVLMNAEEGLYTITRHLIEAHGYRRIAHLGAYANELSERGPSRLKAYADALTAAGIPVDERLIIPDVDLTEGYGVAAMRALLDERGLRPGRDLEAVTTFNDDQALGVLKFLQERGIRVPEDIAVVGCDNIAEAAVSHPPLTTVDPQWLKMGRQAAQILLAQLAGATVPLETLADVQVVVRRSCGCLEPMVVQAGAQAAGLPILRDLTDAARRADLFVETITESLHGRGAVSEDLARRLWEACYAAIIPEMADQNAADGFLNLLRELLTAIVFAEADVQTIGQSLLSLLRQALLPTLKPGDGKRDRAEQLWQQGRVLLAEIVRWADERRQFAAEQQTVRIQALEHRLLSTFELNQILDTLAAELPQFGFPGFWLSLYADQARGVAGEARLLAAYTDQRRMTDAEGRHFPARQVAPDDLRPSKRPYDLVVEALFFEAEQLGVIAFEAGRCDGRMYGLLRGAISNALQGSLLVQRVRERSAEIARQKYILDTFMDTVPDSIYFKDRASRFIHVNRAVVSLLGVADERKLIGKSDFDFFAEDLARPKYEQEQRIIQTGTPVLALEEPDAGGRWSLTTKMPLRDEHGAIIGTFGISHDITALKQAQAALEQAYAAVEQRVKERTAELQQEIAQRTRAEDEIRTLNAELEHRVAERTADLEAVNKELQNFAYVVSHDLKAPLRGIAHLAQWLVEDYGAQFDANGQNMIALLVGRVNRLDNLIEGILQYSRIGRTNMEEEPVDLHLLVPRVIDNLAAPDHIQIRVDSTLPMVHCNLTRMTQVFQNLIGNAVKFLDKPQGKITISCQDQGAAWLFRITDNGPGIDTRYHDRIFEIFQTLTPRDQHESTGIGLALVKKIVEWYAGKVWVESTVGEGSTFLFTLPKA